jgi:hypothetical protein
MYRSVSALHRIGKVARALHAGTGTTEIAMSLSAIGLARLPLPGEEVFRLEIQKEQRRMCRQRPTCQSENGGNANATKPDVRSRH